MRLAFVHDHLNQYGGAEKVLSVMREIYPEAPVYTLSYSPEKIPEALRPARVIVPQNGADNGQSGFGLATDGASYPI